MFPALMHSLPSQGGPETRGCGATCARKPERLTTPLHESFSSNTPRTAVFAGSMQLLAGVKLCTGRTLTNHPHFEDSSLRERTKAVRPSCLARAKRGSRADVRRAYVP